MLPSRPGPAERVDQWIDDPRRYRRCYQGLVRSYFTYDAQTAAAEPVGRENWLELRDYLYERTPELLISSSTRTGCKLRVGNRQLFSNEPCAPYAEDVLKGATSAIDRLCEQLGIIKASWFLRELVLAQVRQATKLDQAGFVELMPRLLGLLAGIVSFETKGLFSF